MTLSKIQHISLTALQVVVLSLIWQLADTIVPLLHIPLPSNVVGMFLLLALLFSKVLKVEWFKIGATWLIAEMLLFFIPAVIAIVNYQDLFLDQGLKITVVIGLSTVSVLIVTALCVDTVYRHEIKKMRGTE